MCCQLSFCNTVQRQRLNYAVLASDCNNKLIHFLFLRYVLKRQCHEIKDKGTLRYKKYFLPSAVERLYCKRPIQCLASYKILTPHPLTARRVYPQPLPPLVRGEDTLAGWKGGGGSIFFKTPDTALYSTYVSALCPQLYHDQCGSLQLFSSLPLEASAMCGGCSLPSSQLTAEDAGRRMTQLRRQQITMSLFLYVLLYSGHTSRVA
jgi:hypothetical protein